MLFDVKHKLTFSRNTRISRDQILTPDKDSRFRCLQSRQKSSNMRTENILGLNEKKNNISKSTSFITHKYINNTTIFNKPIECICHNYISASIWDASHRDASHWNASHWYAENGPRLNGTRLIDYVPHWRVLLWRALVWRVSLWRVSFWRDSSSARFSLARFQFGVFLFGAFPNFVSKLIQYSRLFNFFYFLRRPVWRW